MGNEQSLSCACFLYFYVNLWLLWGYNIYNFERTFVEYIHDLLPHGNLQGASNIITEARGGF